RRLLAAFVVLVAISGCASARETPPMAPPSTYAPIAQLTRAAALDADGWFGADLLSRLDGSSGNAVLSPYSIAVALQMALEVARRVRRGRPVARLPPGPGSGTAHDQPGRVGADERQDR